MKNYKQSCIRLNENSKSILAWAKGEELVGIKDSLFICEEGKVTQFVEEKEGINFYEFVRDLSEKKFDKICEEFFEAIEEKDLVKMHKGLSIFDELDRYDFGTESMKKRLMRIRETTQDES